MTATGPAAPVDALRRHVVAIGGGGMADAGGDNALRRYLLRLSGKEVPNVCFVGTASGDDESYAEAFFASFSGLTCRLSRLTLLAASSRAAEEQLAGQDVVYVGGGDAFYMLVLWRSHGVDGPLRRAWERGAVMCGVSAGSMCWFESGIRRLAESEFKPLSPFLGLLLGSSCPHYDSQPARRAAYLDLVAAGTLPPGYAISDGAALHFVGTDLAESVTFRAGAAAYRVQVTDGQAVEHRLLARPL